MNFETEILHQQRQELTESIIYANLAKSLKNKENKSILEQISKDELKHHNIWQSITKKVVKPYRYKIFLYVFLARIFGLTFSLRLMEGGESDAQEIYKILGTKYPEALTIELDEEKHERQLIKILKDKRLTYAGSIVLGLNDALVELTGTLAGLTLAFGNSRIIGITGLIMGIAASLSMASSGYLSSKEGDNDEENPITSAIYTGVSYIITVVLLVTPYFIFDNVFQALGIMLSITVIIIASYTFYISVAKQQSFIKKFLEMVLISLGVAFISFIIGYGVNKYFGLDI